MSYQDILFKGIPRGPTRGYTADVLRSLTAISKVIVPCAGSFSLAQVAMAGGVNPLQIMCGDVSLYSHALGHAIMNEDFDLKLNETEDLEFLQPLMKQGPVAKAAAVLYSIRVLQYRRKKESRHWSMMRSELLDNGAEYVIQLEAQIQLLQDRLGGIRYKSQDLWKTLEENMGDENAVLLVNPPRYTGGYETQFAGVAETWEWDEPEYKTFDEPEYEPLMEMLGKEPALTLMYYATPKEDPCYLWGKPWSAIFADRPGAKRGVSINWIIANRSPIDLQVTRYLSKSEPRYFKLFHDEDITEDSVLSVVSVDKATGEHYRDMLIHRLEGSQADRYVALFVDGRMFGIVGTNSYAILEFKTKLSEEQMTGLITFCFTVESEKYKRLQKLALMCAVSEFMWEAAYGTSTWFQAMGSPNRVETTMLTRYPEVKTARGVMKRLVSEPAEPPHKFRLVYGAEMEQRTPAETLKAWFAKWSGGTKK